MTASSCSSGVAPSSPSDSTRPAGAGTPDGLDRYTRSLVEHRTRSIEHDLEWVDELTAAEKSSAHEEGATA